uniref:Ig-like domain-containing protein n=1 Tax=Neogobius melanostomus TaxID=47308 RepID=A0A8C6SK49_9GOBI
VIVKVSVLFQIHMELLTLILLTLWTLWTTTGGEWSPPGNSLWPGVRGWSSVQLLKFILDLVIEWKKLEGSVTVHYFDEGKDEPEKQKDPFRCRTSLFPEQFFVGNTSMQLFKVTVDDEGIYQCINIMSLRDVLVCSSEGIYPQPNVSWAPPSRHKTQIEPMTDRRFSVTSSLSLDVQPPQQYSCNISTDHSWKSATYSLQRECAPVHSVRAPLFYTSSHQQEVNKERDCSYSAWTSSSLL